MKAGLEKLRASLRAAEAKLEKLESVWSRGSDTAIARQRGLVDGLREAVQVLAAVRS